MTGMVNPIIEESSIPIQVLYNKKIDKIRFLEYEGKSNEQPIRFNISEAYSGIET